MFPLSCARVRAHTDRKTRTHKKTRNTQKNIFPKMFCTYTSMYKNTYGNIIFCALHVFLLSLMHLSRDFTRSRYLQKFTKSYFCIDIKLSEFISFIHSGHFYSAPSSPLLLRGAPDYSTDTVSEFHAEAHSNCR